MLFKVLLTRDAQNDLEELYEYIAQRDSHSKADHVLEHISSTLLKLSHFPERGVFPKELAAIGVREYREVFFKPYRIIYRIIDESVYVLLIVDGRRDMQSLLHRRLLNA